MEDRRDRSYGSARLAFDDLAGAAWSTPTVTSE